MLLTLARFSMLSEITYLEAFKHLLQMVKCAVAYRKQWEHH